MLNDSVKKKTTIVLDGKEITVETGEVAKQARGSVLVRCGDTVVLVTVCISHEPKAGTDFLRSPLITKKKPTPPGKFLAVSLSVKLAFEKKKFSRPD
jgi:polyribonucleotide nucleotidyltransferase